MNFKSYILTSWNPYRYIIRVLVVLVEIFLAILGCCSALMTWLDIWGCSFEDLYLFKKHRCCPYTDLQIKKVNIFYRTVCILGESDHPYLMYGEWTSIFKHFIPSVIVHVWPQIIQKHYFRLCEMNEKTTLWGKRSVLEKVIR